MDTGYTGHLEHRAHPCPPLLAPCCAPPPAFGPPAVFFLEDVIPRTVLTSHAYVRNPTDAHTHPPILTTVLGAP